MALAVSSHPPSGWAFALLGGASGAIVIRDFPRLGMASLFVAVLAFGGAMRGAATDRAVVMGKDQTNEQYYSIGIDAPPAILAHRPGNAVPNWAEGTRWRAPVSLMEVAPRGIPVLAIGNLAGAKWGEVRRVTGTIRPAIGPPARLLLFVRESDLDRPQPQWLAGFEQVRERFRSAAYAVGGPGGQLVTGLAIGDTTPIAPELVDAMRASGLSHLTAVSGANCAVVILVAAYLARLVGLGRVGRVCVAMAALALFVILVTPQPSVLRAATMAVIALLAALKGAKRAGIAALSLAVTVLLVADPWLSFDVGFTLSVLASAGIIVLAPAISARLPRAFGPIAPLVALPVAAQVSCLPVLVMLSPEIPLSAIPANLLAAPLAPAATLLGLIACLLGLGDELWGTGPAQSMVWLAARPAEWIAAIARGGAELGSAPWPAPPQGPILATIVVASVVTSVLAARGRIRRIGAAVAVSVTCATMLPALAVPNIVRMIRPTDWQVAQCDVGQGDALVLRSAGAVALIDTGPEPAQLSRCLAELGIQRIDLLVLSHFDRDHAGGLPALGGRVTRALVGPGGEARASRSDSPRQADRAQAQMFRGLLESGGTEITTARRGLSGRLGEATWRILWPLPGETQPGNPASVVMEWRTDEWTGVFLGDLDAAAQRSLTAAGIPRGVDLVKVAHHGSADQSADLYARLAAPISLIGVSPSNRFGHPHPRTLTLLGETKSLVYRTDRHGLSLVSFHDTLGTVWTERGNDRSPRIPTRRHAHASRHPKFGFGLEPGSTRPGHRNVWPQRLLGVSGHSGIA